MKFRQWLPCLRPEITITVAIVFSDAAGRKDDSNHHCLFFDLPLSSFQQEAEIGMGVSRKKAEQNRRRILDSTEQLVRVKGVDGVGLAELMKKAGFTQGGFYNHFASKEALISEVLGKALSRGWEQLNQTLDEGREQGDSPVEYEIEWYLSPAHRNDVKGGCPIAGFASEVPRLSKADQRAYARGLDMVFAKIAETLMEENAKLRPDEARKRAVSIYSHMVGSVLLSRAVAAADSTLAGEILADGRDCLEAFVES